MYCSIQEAWPEHNFFNNNINSSPKVENFNNIPNPTSNIRADHNPINPINSINSTNSILDRGDKRPEFYNNYAQHNANQQYKSDHFKTNNFKTTSKTNNHLNQLNHFDQLDKFNQMNNSSHPTHLVHQGNSYDCDDIIEHIKSCSECRRMIQMENKSNNIMELFKTNPQLKETVVVFLLGLLIIMILNLLYK
jgi:hypothetical protein